MPRRPASMTQADIARIIRAAKQAGAASVEIRQGDAVIVIRLNMGVPEWPSIDEESRIVL